MDINSSMASGWTGSLRNQVKVADDNSRNSAVVADAQTPLAEVLPAAIYHPSTEVPEGPSDFDAYMQIGRPPRTDGSVPRPENSILEDIAGAERDLLSALDSFVQDLSKSDPTLAQQKFGFSVDKDGKLVAIDSHGSLSRQQQERLTTALNQSQGMVDASNRLARFQIERVESDNVNGYGRFQLDFDNYAQTIDLGAAVGFRSGINEAFDGIWFNQLWTKGEVKYGDWVKIIDSGR